MTTLSLALPAAATPPVASGTGSKASSNSSSGFDAMLAEAMPGQDLPGTDGPGQDVPATPQGEVPVSILLQAELLGAGEAAADGEVAAEVPERATEESTAGVAGRTDAVDAGALFLTPAPFSLAEAVRLTAAAQDGAVVTTGTPSDQTSGPTTGPTTGSTPSTGTGQSSGQSSGAMAGEGAADALAPLAGPTTDRTDDGAAQETGFAARGSGAPGTSGDAVPAPGAGSTTPGAPTPTSVSAGTVDVSALTPVSAASAASSPSVNGAAAPATAPASPAQQVMPEVSRLVQRGDGTHRLTLTLTPEALGDVRVTLTVRQGEVSVSFAAGDEARRALIESTPELRRLLELGGATTSRVTVSDLTGGRPGDGTGQRPDDGSGSWLDQSREGGQTGADSGGQPRGSDRTPQDLHAGTRAGTTATDGNHRGPGDAGRPLDPGTSTRPAGLDVTV